MSQNLLHKAAFALYDFTWRVALPWLKLNQRLAEGFDQRALNEKSPDQADLWIQAASVGESYLALEILKVLDAKPLTRILVTSNTRQGIDILEKSLPDINRNSPNIYPVVRYFPFDKPSIMTIAVDQIQPKVMVLLETEIWPGLLQALRSRRCRIIVINGRITEKSLKRYRLWPSIWQSLRPDKILAVSSSDAERFEQLFGKQGVEVMANIKFDRLAPSNNRADSQFRIKPILPTGTPFVVFASVRREEESEVIKIVHEVARDRSQPVMGVFPRHIHRLRFWQDALTESGLPWVLRSTLSTPISTGTVILWDKFGELMPAYRLAQSAFVGGSLAPLGGQNFLEALVCGVIPVIGPSWENFAWVGQEIVDAGLLKIADDWRQVAAFLRADMTARRQRNALKDKAQQFLRTRQGGTRQACRQIEAMLFEKM